MLRSDCVGSTKRCDLATEQKSRRFGKVSAAENERERSAGTQNER